MSGAAHVLVVDDNAALAENLAEVLTEAGFRSGTAASCEEARARVEESAVDVALVDVRLPDGEGIELAAELKGRRPELEVILLTGFASLESSAAAVRAGAFAFLLKPVPPPELILTVEQALRQARLHQEKRELSRRTMVAEKLATVGTLTAGLSHEIRNPLNAANLQLAVLERRVRKLPPEQATPLIEPLSLVRDEIIRLNHILENFLQFARPAQVPTTPVDLAQLVRSLEPAYQRAAQERGLRLVATANGDGPLLVAGDELRLRQALVNLLLNGLQACSPGAEVTVSAHGTSDEVLVRVVDEGPGVPKELAERIFEPFFTTRASGSGLGLSIVHAIVQQHGGSIRQENRPEGGAAFTVALPRKRR